LLAEFQHLRSATHIFVASGTEKGRFHFRRNRQSFRPQPCHDRQPHGYVCHRHQHRSGDEAAWTFQGRLKRRDQGAFAICDGMQLELIDSGENRSREDLL
jgi:hypothetical protein